MPATVQTLITCAPAPGAASVAPCAADTAPATVQALVLSPDQLSLYESMAAGPDYALASSIWSAAVGIVVLSYFLPKIVAILIRMVRVGLR